MKNSWLVIAAVVGLTVASASGPSAPAQALSAKTIDLPPDNAMGTLKAGPGLDVVKSNCATCHSTDYIVRQPGGDVKHWDPEVHKMISVYGAQINDSDARTIVNYLATEYSAPPDPEIRATPVLRTGRASPAPKRKSKATGPY